MNIDAQFELPDGRLLAYAEFGDPRGQPVIYCHGSPSSRLEPLLIGDDRIRQAGLRVIAVDRPGMGGSDFVAGRAIVDWTRELVMLAEHVGFERFAVLGNSGGAPYAALCAARIPERLSAAVIVSGGWQMTLPEATAGLPSINRLMLGIARRAPFLLGPLFAGMAAGAGGPREQQLAQLASRMPPADHAAFSKPGVIEAFNQVIKECMRQGTRGAAWDMRLYVRELGVRAADAKLPIRMFHGALDANAPLALARKLSQEFPGATLTVYPDDAHLSTLTERFDDIAQALRA